jgi:hypothetical protein
VPRATRRRIENLARATGACSKAYTLRLPPCVGAQDDSVFAPMFRRLDPDRIVETAAALRRRISERFPGSGLSRVASELEAVTREAAEVSVWMARPHLAIRFAVGTGILVLVVAVLVAATTLVRQLGPQTWSDWVQGLEALVNDVVFVGIAAYFLLGVEVRQKRKRALAALHVLRSLAHIVDMHQLTKDPEQLVGGGPRTASSPQRTMTSFQLARYLDYSTELLAIISKVAALYVQELGDPITMAAANAVEELAVNLSRTIWQKIIILDRVQPAEAVRDDVRAVSE